MRGKLLFGAAIGALASLGLGASAFAQGADQPADTTTTSSLTPGAAATGVLGEAGDSDWFRLSVEAGNRYRITLNGDGESALGDPLLVVYDASGSEINRNDDNDGSLNSRLDYVPAASGVVFVEARGFSDSATGSYVLRAESTVLPPDNAGNSAATRARVTPGTPINAGLEYEGDTDWYRLDVRDGRTYRITLNSAETEGVGDPLLILYNSDGEEISRNDDYEGLNSRLDHAPAERGVVYVEARGLSDQATGNYTLNVTEARLPPDPAANNIRTRARLAFGEPVNAGLDYAGDKDWYRVTLTEGQSYRFTLRTAEDGGIDDPMMRLLDASGAELLVDDDGGGNLNSFIEYTAPSSGNYFIEARGFMDDASGNYVLTAAQGDIPADASTDVSLSADGDYREGNLGTPGDKDWFRLDLQEGQSVRIGLDSGMSEPLDDPMLVVYGPDSAELARDDDGGVNLNSWLEFTAPTTGSYYVEAGGFSEEAQGRYSIMVLGGEIGADAESAHYLMMMGDSHTSVISGGGDSDWFGLELVEGRPYRINVESTEPGALVDPLVTLYDSEGNVLATDDDGGTDFNAYLYHTAVTGGPVYAAVSSFDGSSEGRYTIRVTDTDVPGHIYTDEYLQADPGDLRVGQIDVVGDADFFSVNLTAQVRYTITVSGHGERPVTDPFLTIVNSAGEDVTSDDDSGPGLDARLVFRPETTDTYFIKATGLGNSVGGYQVAIMREE